MTEQSNEATIATADAHAMDDDAGDAHIAGMGISLADLLSGMGGEPEVPPLDPAEARGILRGAFERLTTVHEFKPGDFVRRKPGFYTGTKEPRGGVAVFLRYGLPEAGDYEPHHIDAPAAVVNANCALLIVTDEGSVGEYYADSDYYEPAPAVEAVA